MKPAKLLLHGILEDFAKIKCCKNKYPYGIGMNDIVNYDYIILVPECNAQ